MNVLFPILEVMILLRKLRIFNLQRDRDLLWFEAENHIYKKRESGVFLSINIFGINQDFQQY